MPKTTSTPWIDDLVRLRLRSMRAHGIPTRDRYARTLKKDLLQAWKDSKKPDGFFEILFDRGLPIAYATLARGSGWKQLKKRKNLWRIQIDAHPVNTRAIRWLGQTIKKNSRALAQTKSAGLMPSLLKPLVPELTRAGVHLDCVVLLGKTSVAKRRFKPTTPRTRDLFHWPGDLLVRRLQKQDIPHVVNLVRGEFRRNPQFGWIMLKPEFIRNVAKMMRKSLRSRFARQLVVVRKNDGKIVGDFGYVRVSSALYGGPAASFGVNLHRSLQGKGYARWIYSVLLHQIQKEKIEYFVGGTAQPGVMKLGKKMGRTCIAYELKSGKPFFPAKYFLSY